jgi:flagellin-like hook-associated protein FlgL
MEINSIAQNHMLADYRSTNSRLSVALSRIASGERAAKVQDDPVTWNQVERLKTNASNLQGYTDNLHRAAATVRIALDSMGVAQAHMGQAEEKLVAAFEAAPGSYERSNALNAYNDLVDLVEDTNNTPDPVASRLLQDPSVNPDAGDVRISAGEDQYKIALHAREIHTGATGINLPKAGDKIPSDPIGTAPLIADINNATDAEIQAMIAQFHQSRDTLTERVNLLSLNLHSVDISAEFNQQFIHRNQNVATDLNLVDLNAEAVLTQSLSVRGELSIAGLGGLQETYGMALQLLK